MAPPGDRVIAESGENDRQNGRTIAGVLLALLIVGGAAAIGITGYMAGVTAGLVESGRVVVAPGTAGGPYVGGYNEGHGYRGFFGFLGFLLLILLFAFLRAVFGGWGRRGGWGGRGWGPEGRHGYGPWNDRMRELHDELHRSGGSTGTGTTGSGPTGQSRT